MQEPLDDDVNDNETAMETLRLAQQRPQLDSTSTYKSTNDVEVGAKDLISPQRPAKHTDSVPFSFPTTQETVTLRSSTHSDDDKAAVQLQAAVRGWRVRADGIWNHGLYI